MMGGKDESKINKTDAVDIDVDGDRVDGTKIK